MTQPSTDQQKVRELLEPIRFAMLATHDGQQIVSRPMTPQRIEEDLAILFITQRDTDVARQADGQPVNLSFVDSGTFVSIAGTGELRDDVELKKELWSTATDAYTDSGPEDPQNVILAVVPDTASYWDSAAAPVWALSLLKAKVTGTKPDSGEHDTVDL